MARFSLALVVLVLAFARPAAATRDPKLNEDHSFRGNFGVGPITGKGRRPVALPHEAPPARGVIALDDIRTSYTKQISQHTHTKDLSRDVSGVLQALEPKAREFDDLNKNLGAFDRAVIEIVSKKMREQKNKITEEDLKTVFKAESERLNGLAEARGKNLIATMEFLKKSLTEKGFEIVGEPRNAPYRMNGMLQLLADAVGKWKGVPEAMSLVVKGRNGNVAIEIADGRLHFSRANAKGEPIAFPVSAKNVEPLDFNFPPDGKNAVDRNSMKDFPVVPVLRATSLDSAHLSVYATIPPTRGQEEMWRSSSALPAMELVEYGVIRQSWQRPTPTEMNAETLNSLHNIQLRTEPPLPSP